MESISHIFIALVAFYLFCLSMAHVFMYKPDEELFNQLREQWNSYIFALLGIGIWTLLKKLKTPERWVHPIYIVVFLIMGSASFYLITKMI